MEKGEKVTRRKYESPTVTRVPFTGLSLEMRGEFGRMVSTSASEPARLTRWDTGFRVVLDVEGRFKQVSKEFTAVLGYAEKELFGKRIDEVTASRTVRIPRHLGAVVHFGQFHCLWMFVHRDGHGVLVRSDWELLPDLSIEVFGELLPG